MGFNTYAADATVIKTLNTNKAVIIILAGIVSVSSNSVPSELYGLGNKVYTSNDKKIYTDTGTAFTNPTTPDPGLIYSCIGYLYKWNGTDLVPIGQDTDISGKANYFTVHPDSDNNGYFDNVNLPEGEYNYGHGFVTVREWRDSDTNVRIGLYQIKNTSNTIEKRRLYISDPQIYPEWVSVFQDVDDSIAFWADLINTTKADLVDGKVPASQLPLSTSLTETVTGKVADATVIKTLNDSISGKADTIPITVLDYLGGSIIFNDGNKPLSIKGTGISILDDYRYDEYGSGYGSNISIQKQYASLLSSYDSSYNDQAYGQAFIQTLVSNNHSRPSLYTGACNYVGGNTEFNSSINQSKAGLILNWSGYDNSSGINIGGNQYGGNGISLISNNNDITIYDQSKGGARSLFSLFDGTDGNVNYAGNAGTADWANQAGYSNDAYSAYSASYAYNAGNADGANYAGCANPGFVTSYLNIITNVELEEPSMAYIEDGSGTMCRMTKAQFKLWLGI